MGSAKREMERIEGLRQQALDMAIGIDAIEECEDHSGTYLWNGDDDKKKHAYAVGTNMCKAGNVDGTRKEFMDAIDSVFSDAGDECYSCEKNRRD